MSFLGQRALATAPSAGVGHIVTLWGPTGSPGRSTLAIALAGVLAPTMRVVLVDADRSRGALGPLLGITSGGTIVGAATVAPPPDAPCRPRDLQAHRAGFSLIRGVVGPAQEATLDPSDLTALLTRLRTAFDLILVDVGAALPPREFGDLHLAALRASNLVLAVGALTTLGLSDLLLQARVLAERLDPQGLHPVAAGPPAWCVLNKGRGSLLRYGTSRVAVDLGLPIAATVPLDTRNVMAAEEAHLPLTVARPRSPSAAVVRRLAERLRRALSALSPYAGDNSEPEMMRTFFVKR